MRRVFNGAPNKLGGVGSVNLLVEGDRRTRKGSRRNRGGACRHDGVKAIVEGLPLHFV